MNTPVADFVRAYAGSGVSRLHMPGHKGQPFLGCEALDITEVQGADRCLRRRASSGRVRSMLLLYSAPPDSVLHRGLQPVHPGHAVFGPHLPPCRDGPADPGGPECAPGFVYAAALLDLPVRWLWPQAGGSVAPAP